MEQNELTEKIVGVLEKMAGLHKSQLEASDELTKSLSEVLEWKRGFDRRTTLAKIVIKGWIIGVLFGALVTYILGLGYNLWQSASPDGRLNAFVMILVFFLGIGFTFLGGRILGLVRQRSDQDNETLK